MSKLTSSSVKSIADDDAIYVMEPSRLLYRCAAAFVRGLDNICRGGTRCYCPENCVIHDEPRGSASSHLKSTCYIVLAGLLGLWLVMFAVSPRARAQAQDHYHPGHAKFHDIYKGWVQSNGFSSCCNGDDPELDRKGDCRPARAYLDPDDNLWRVLINGKWLIVPPQAVRPYSTPDGNSHVCEDARNGIMCFVGGQPKS